jgi:hypothetical protein
MSQATATFTTSGGFVLSLKPVPARLVNKVAAQAATVKGAADEVQAHRFHALVADLISEGVTKFKLTKEQEALVTLTRPMIKERLPWFNLNLPDFTLYVVSLAPTYEELTRLALAILEVTKVSQPKPVRDPLALFKRSGKARK